jgi:hypothetical protein
MTTDYPTVDYPTVVSGRIVAPIIRYESLDSSVLEEAVPGGSIELKMARPFERGGKMWAVTHLQKYSTEGWLKMDPDCFHAWKFWKLQERRPDANGVTVWVPGTEQGIYFRKSRVLLRLKCWRWDVAGTMIDGQLRHWISSGGYFGGHWD